MVGRITADLAVTLVKAAIPEAIHPLLREMIARVRKGTSPEMQEVEVRSAI